MERSSTAPLRAHNAPVDRSLNQSDTLRSVKLFLRDLIREEGKYNMDPRRLYNGVCGALGEKPDPDLIEA